MNEEDAARAASLPLWIEDLDDESPARQLRLGFDTAGRLLETVVLTFDSGNELVIHAMKARPQMLDLLP
ncbi:toxin [Demequina sp. NBRC 110056]|uniref:toxin n=1 Tax=Demequina sp. NBRC 110056 TaxID=1570345 RepID=UPI001F175690|nr:toxin [Demequina sp. NBRC 110056]